MADNFSPDMIRGHIDTFILLSLKNQDRDSNEIRLDIEAKSGNKYSVKQGTFYSAMQRLVKQNHISEYRSSASDGIRRKYFSLTEKGRKFLEKSIEDWGASKGFIDEMIDAPKVADTPKETKVETKTAQVDDFDYFKNLADNSDIEIATETNIDDGALDKVGDEVFENLMAELGELAEESAENEIVKDVKNGDIIEENKDNYETETASGEEISDGMIQQEFDFSSLGSISDDEQETETQKEIIVETKKPETVKPVIKTEPKQEKIEEVKNYKEVLNKLFPKTTPHAETSEQGSESQGADLPTETENDHETATTKEVLPKTVGANEIDFSDLYNMANCEGFKIRTSQSTNKRTCNRIFINKLRFDASLIFTAVMLVEMLIMKLAFGTALDWPVSLQIVLPIVLLLFPIFTAIARVIEPLATVDEIKTFSEAIEIALLVTFQILIIIFGIALFSSVDFNNLGQTLNFIVIPAIFDINVPIYFIIKYALLSRGKYFEK